MRLKDKVAIVTGASRSLGRAVALRYAAEGAAVVVGCGSDEQAANEVVAQIESAGGQALAIRADVSIEAEVVRLVKRTTDTFGRIDILVNNAGVDPRQHWLDISGDDWDRVMRINVKSQFLCTQAVFPHMKAVGGGHMINVSSVVFWRGQSGYAHYVASKGAIVGLTRAMARELGEHNIRVNCITPGAVLTETELDKLGSAEAQEQASAYLLQEQALKRRETTDDIVGAFVFLASADCGFVTGQCLNVDGGWIMH
ncbi:SDR family NAD(P)-dependent oxidoreductase [Paenibacillus koleovorans]|uniref:SDR family NAD(P)-dependent oxidoreductase n=1 Tax=Paenibacillus koleovorans TaxID=121608 RepID=UPI0013E3617A|nr:3-oxoacyl-ACP reductase family protein [Paenibacillus koleovorans]